MVATPSIERELRDLGFERIQPWTRGVDAKLFTPERRVDDIGFPRPLPGGALRIDA